MLFHLAGLPKKNKKLPATTKIAVKASTGSVSVFDAGVDDKFRDNSSSAFTNKSILSYLQAGSFAMPQAITSFNFGIKAVTCLASIFGIAVFICLYIKPIGESARKGF